MLAIKSGAALEAESLPEHQTIPGYLADICEQYGNREAVVMRCPDGSTVRHSYAEFAGLVEQVAKALIASGVDRGTRVGVLMSNRTEYLAAAFGIAAAGGVCVALNTFSTASELHLQLTDAAVAVLLFEERVLKQDFAATLRSMAGEGCAPFVSLPFLREMVWLPSVTSTQAPASIDEQMTSWREFLSRSSVVSSALLAARQGQLFPGDPAGIFFSSGTTSRPKGIIHSQRAFVIQWVRCPRIFAVGDGSRTWTGNGFFWSANIAMAVGCAFSSGGAIIIQPVFDENVALELIAQERISFLMGRPHQWSRLKAASGWGRADLSSLKQITKGEIITSHPTVDTDWIVPNSFGTTETLALCTSFDANTSEEDYAQSFGGPLPGNTLKVVNPMTAEPVSCGERGEICIKGPTLMLGYLGKLWEDCFDEQGYYRTGDGGYVDDQGRLYWEGRLTDIIKCGGANVSPEEVDTVIAGFPGVKRTQTLGVPDDLLGETIVSCIVPVADAELDSDTLRTHLKQELASYKLPRTILYFSDDEYPSRPTRK